LPAPDIVPCTMMGLAVTRAPFRSPSIRMTFYQRFPPAICPKGQLRIPAM